MLARASDATIQVRWRLLRGYVLSRRLPGSWLLMLALLGAVICGGGWGREHEPMSLWLLTFLLPMATASVIGVSLWSPFGETERAAGTWLPLARSLHLASLLVAVLLVNQVAETMWVPSGDSQPWAAYLLRHTTLLIGIALLAARVIDSRLSWVAPAVVALSGVAMGLSRVERAVAEGQSVTFFHDSWHPMLRPADSTVSQVVAIGVFLVGVGLVVWSGERLVDPEDAAG